jgi:ribosomal protein L10
MNKGKLKKKINSDNLQNLYKNCNFIGFFCMQNITVNDKIQLKKKLAQYGFHYILIKNSAVFKTLFNSVPKLKGLVSGSLAICYNKDKTEKSTNFTFLKDIFSFMQKKKNIFFLGGLLNGSFVNRLFEVKVCSLKDRQSINIEHVSLLQTILTNITRTTSIPKNHLSFLMSTETKLK